MYQVGLLALVTIWAGVMLLYTPWYRRAYDAMREEYLLLRRHALLFAIGFSLAFWGRRSMGILEAIGETVIIISVLAGLYAYARMKRNRVAHHRSGEPRDYE